MVIENHSSLLLGPIPSGRLKTSGTLTLSFSLENVSRLGLALYLCSWDGVKQCFESCGTSRICVMSRSVF